MNINNIVGDIYDCAATPELWPVTLGKIRDMADLAYVMIGYMGSSATNPKIEFNNLKYSEWDALWVQRLQQHLPTIPHLDRLFLQGIDVPWLQMDHLPEDEFRKTDFYRKWVQPQKLRDGMNTLFIDRKIVRGVMVMTRCDCKPLMGERERQLAKFISPHVRRAIAINDVVDRGKLALSLHRRVLDTLSVAVFIVSTGGKLVFSNSRADDLLSSGDLLHLVANRLATSRADFAGDKFSEAIARGIKGDNAIGIAGIGLPVIGVSGERAAAYVLPIAASDSRSQLGQGHVAVFIARRGEQQPMIIEVLRTLFDLTPMEAKVAYATSLGDDVDVIAQTFGNSVETVRSHLKSTYKKADVNGKTELAARIHELVPPIELQPEL